MFYMLIFLFVVVVAALVALFFPFSYRTFKRNIKKRKREKEILKGKKEVLPCDRLRCYASSLARARFALVE